MLRKLMLLAITLTLFSLISCASVPEEPRYTMFSAPKEILSCSKFVILPVSVMNEYVPSGDSELDSYLQNNPEVWQKEIASYFLKMMTEKGLNRQVEMLHPTEFRKQLEVLLAKNNRKGFINPDTGTFDDGFYKLIMTDLAEQYKATLIVPRLILQQITASTGSSLTSMALGPVALLTLPLDLMSSNKVQWDGVSRSFETGSAKFSRVFGGSSRSAGIDALSLYVEGFDSNGKKFWSRGGFDVRSKIGATEIVKKDVNDIFKETDNLKESVAVSLELLFN